MLPHLANSSPVCVLAFALFASACAGPGYADEDDGTILGRWTIETVGDERVHDGSEPSLEFRADGSFGGHAGVNRFSGEWSGDADALALSPLAVTRMAGPPELMEQEARLLGLLGEAVAARRDGSLLTLTDGTGTGLVRASQPELRWKRLRGSAEFAVPAELEPGHELEVSIASADDGDFEEGVHVSGTGQSAIPFLIRYRVDAIDPDARYELTARVRKPTGELVWQTVRPIPVLGPGTPKSGVRVVLVRVE